MWHAVLCPVALDDRRKDSRWPKRVMEYNILDFSAWKDDSTFGDMFRKLIDGLELFYKGTQAENVQASEVFTPAGRDLGDCEVCPEQKR